MRASVWKVVAQKELGLGGWVLSPGPANRLRHSLESQHRVRGGVWTRPGNRLSYARHRGKSAGVPLNSAAIVCDVMADPPSLSLQTASRARTCRLGVEASEPAGQRASPRETPRQCHPRPGVTGAPGASRLLLGDASPAGTNTAWKREWIFSS